MSQLSPPPNRPQDKKKAPPPAVAHPALGLLVDPDRGPAPQVSPEDDLAFPGLANLDPAKGFVPMWFPGLKGEPPSQREARFRQELEREMNEGLGEVSWEHLAKAQQGKTLLRALVHMYHETNMG